MHLDSNTTRIYLRLSDEEVKQEGAECAFVVRLPVGLAGFQPALHLFQETRAAAQALVPHVVDQAWFFDTELLILAEKRGFRIKDIPVTWTDDPDTRVKVMGTAVKDVRGLLRLRFGGLPRVERPPAG